MYTFNLMADSPQVRYEMLEGRQHVVVPMVMLKEGVWPGTDGPLLYEDKVLKNHRQWNYRPIVAYHPSMETGDGSANNPLVLNTQKVGVVLNAYHKDKKLGAEAWFDVERTKLIDNRIITAISNREKMNVSTGIIANKDGTPGQFNGTDYKEAVVSMQADHLAVLPDQSGACSVDDGAGLLQNKKLEQPLVHNEMSFDNISSALFTEVVGKLNKPDDEYLYIQDVYGSFFVYNYQGKLWKLNYSVSDSGVTVSGDPEQVVQVTEYRTVAGAFVGNVSEKSLQKEGEAAMLKKELVDKLIANESLPWEEGDRAQLMTLNEKTLEKMVPPEKKPEEPPADTVVQNNTPVPVATAVPVQNNNKPLTEAEYIAQMPAGIRETLQEGMVLRQQRRDGMINTITQNARCTFTKEELAGKTNSELEKLVQFCEPQPVYNGAQGGGDPSFYNPHPTAVQNASKQEPLPLPKMEFSKN